MGVNQDQNEREPGKEVDKEVRKSDDAEVTEPPSKKPKITYFKETEPKSYFKRAT